MDAPVTTVPTPAPGPASGLRAWVQGRSGRILRAAAAGLSARGVAMLVSFATIPLTVRYLGGERYGAWVTISTLLAWLQLADLGLGNALTNALATAHGDRDQDAARAYVATAFWTFAAVAAALALVFLPIWIWLDWGRVLNVRSAVAQAEVAHAVGLAFALFVLGFPFLVLDRIYAAHQEGWLASYWAMAANVASLAAIVAVTRADGGLVALVGAFSGSRLVVQAASAVWLFGRHRPWLRPGWRHVSLDVARRLGRPGGLFLLLQLAAIALFETDNVVIAQLLGAEAVTPYSVAWRLFTIPSLLVALWFPYLWPAFTEALGRGDVRWMARAFAVSTVVGTATALALAIPLAWLGRPILALLGGPAAAPTAGLLAWMAAWSVINAYCTNVSCLLNAAGRLSLQVACGLVTAAANLVLSVLWAPRHGGAGVIAATVVSYAVLAVLPLSVEAVRLLRSVTKGQRP